MQITEPSAEELQAVLSANPHRYPEIVHLTVPGARGKPQRLTFVLGNPSGACRLPAGVKPSPAWSDVVATTLKLKKNDGNEQIANDCVLYPDLGTFAAWCERWPALADSVWSAARKKFGGVLESLDEPAEGEKLPQAIEDGWSKWPNAALRRFTPRGRKYLVLVDPPAAAPYSFFLDAVRKDDADYWKLSSEMARSSVRLCVDEATGAEVSYDDIAAQWPGVPLLTILTVYVLAGAAADVELGNG